MGFVVVSYNTTFMAHHSFTFCSYVASSMAVCTKRTEALEGVYGVSGRRVCDAEISSFTTQFYKLICVVINLFIG